jgi:hypothetical protein
LPKPKPQVWQLFRLNKFSHSLGWYPGLRWQVGAKSAVIKLPFVFFPLRSWRSRPKTCSQLPLLAWFWPCFGKLKPMWQAMSAFLME